MLKSSDSKKIKTSEEKKSFIFRIISYVLILCGIIYLIIRISEFSDYEGFVSAWKNISTERIYWLILVFLLLPVNLMIESIKWKRTIRQVENISLLKSIASVLTGASTGFITPNKIGDIWGRLQFLRNENREKAAGFLAINSLTQNLAIILLGLPAALIFFSHTDNTNTESRFVYFISGIFILFAGVYYGLPRLLRTSQNQWLNKYISGIKSLAFKDLHEILGWATGRFLIFIVQFYALLHFFGIPITLNEAAIAIPAYYLFITFTPSIAVGDAIIRSSYAVLFLGTISQQVIQISLAGISLWLINIVLPVITGTILIIKVNLGMKKKS